MKGFRKGNKKRIKPVEDLDRRRDAGKTRITQRDEGELDFFRRRAMY